MNNNFLTPLKIANYVKNIPAVNVLCEIRGQELIKLPGNENSGTLLHRLIFYLSTALRESPLSKEADYFRNLLQLYPQAAGLQVNTSVMQPVPRMVLTFGERVMFNVLTLIVIICAALLVVAAANCAIFDFGVVAPVLAIPAALVVVIVVAGLVNLRAAGTAGAVGTVVGGLLCCDSNLIDEVFGCGVCTFLVAFSGLCATLCDCSHGDISAVGVGIVSVAIYIVARLAGGAGSDAFVAIVAAILVASVIASIMFYRTRADSAAQPVGVVVAGLSEAAVAVTNAEVNHEEEYHDIGNIDWGNVEFDNLPDWTVFYAANQPIMWHDRILPYQLAVDKKLPPYYLRLLLRAAPDLNPTELHRLNYLLLCYERSLITNTNEVCENEIISKSNSKYKLCFGKSSMARVLTKSNKELLKQVVSFL